MTYSEMITELNTTLELVFDEGVSSANALWKQVATYVPSEASRNPYRYLGQNLSPSETRPARKGEVAGSGYAIENKDYFTQIEIHRNDLDDHQVSVYGPAVREMGSACVRFVNAQVFKLLSSGFTQTCFDGKSFFSTDHPIKGGTQSNYADGKETAWYILDTSSAFKPLMYQERKAPKIVCMESLDEQHLYATDIYRYGVHLRGNFGYGPYQRAYGSKVDLTEANLTSALSAMLALKDSEGQFLGIEPQVLVVPPSLKSKAMGLLKVDRKADGTLNPLFSALELIVTPYV